MSRRTLVCMTKIATRTFLAAGMLALLAALPQGALAQVVGRANLDAAVAAHLSAGEFGPALDLANRAPAGERDRLLQAVAVAQARGGARQGSLATSAGIYDDRLRSAAVNELAPRGAGGGGPQADFESLIELITSTIQPNSWEDLGGNGAVKPFPGGVYVDARGLMHKISPAAVSAELALLRTEAVTTHRSGDPRRKSALRKVSLNRLERETQLLAATGRDPNEAMANLAGLYAIEYVFVYPESGDVVLAGPAGPWHRNDEGRLVNIVTGRPVLQLDDLVVLLRNAYGKEGRFGCSIVPRQKNLADTQAFLAESAKRPLKPSQRKTWLEQVRSQLGKQDIEVYGIDPRTRVAQVIVEADYRMKLVGMGLEDGVLGVTSYLDSLNLAKGEAAPAMNVLRWWFTLNYDSVAATEDRNAFRVNGPGVKVLSENELLTERGERVHTGKADELTSEFAHSFTKHFGELAARYPVYAELKNVFDLAVAAALLNAEDLPGQAGWHMTHFLDPQGYRVGLGVAPGEVETIINHRVFHGTQIVAGVSGGVAVAPRSLVARQAIKTDDGGLLSTQHDSHAPAKVPTRGWWWD